jgi:hypothetical protein
VLSLSIEPEKWNALPGPVDAQDISLRIVGCASRNGLTVTAMTHAMAGCGLRFMRDRRTGDSADGTAGHGSDRTRDSANARTDGSAADALLGGGAGCRRKTEQRHESELLHENLQRTNKNERMWDTSGCDEGARSLRDLAGLHLTRSYGQGSGQ